MPITRAVSFDHLVGSGKQRLRALRPSALAVLRLITRDGLWRINGKRQAIYVQAILSQRDRIAAAQALTDGDE